MADVSLDRSLAGDAEQDCSGTNQGGTLVEASLTPFYFFMCFLWICSSPWGLRSACMAQGGRDSCWLLMRELEIIYRQQNNNIGERMHIRGYVHMVLSLWKRVEELLHHPFVHDRGSVWGSAHTYGQAHEQKHRIPPRQLQGSFVNIPGRSAAKITEPPFSLGRSKYKLWVQGHNETIKSHSNRRSSKEFSKTSTTTEMRVISA